MFKYNQDVINDVIIWCEKHVKNCALQNEIKTFNWWLDVRKNCNNL